MVFGVSAPSFKVEHGFSCMSITQQTLYCKLHYDIHYKFLYSYNYNTLVICIRVTAHTCMSTRMNFIRQLSIDIE